MTSDFRSLIHLSTEFLASSSFLHSVISPTSNQQPSRSTEQDLVFKTLLLPFPTRKGATKYFVEQAAGFGESANWPDIQGSWSDRNRRVGRGHSVDCGRVDTHAWPMIRSRSFRSLATDREHLSFNMGARYTVAETAAPQKRGTSDSAGPGATARLDALKLED
jgi:hypothetical protein